MNGAIILTALDVEYLAVTAHLEDLREEIVNGTIFEVGVFRSEKGTWSVAVAQVDMGNSSSGIVAERAIARFSPQVAMFVGVAGGVKDVKLGDVVAATKVYGFEAGKDEVTFSTRPSVGRSTYSLVQRARSIARSGSWLQRRIGDPNPTASAVVGPIAAGEKVVASVKSETYRFIREHYSDAIAVEMEGRGFIEAAFVNGDLPAIVIRGISDLVKGKAKSDAQGWQRVASKHAAAKFSLNTIPLRRSVHLKNLRTSLPQRSKLKRKIRDTFSNKCNCPRQGRRTRQSQTKVVNNGYGEFPIA